MVGAINQNNIIEIIKSNMDIVKQTIDLITNNDKLYKTISEFKSRAELTSEIIDHIYRNFIPVMMESVRNTPNNIDIIIPPINIIQMTENDDLKKNEKYLNSYIVIIDNYINIINTLNTSLDKLSNIKSNNISTESFNAVIDNYINIINTLNTSLDKLSNIKSNNISTELFNAVIDNYIGIINSLNESLDKVSNISIHKINPKFLKQLENLNSIDFLNKIKIPNINEKVLNNIKNKISILNELNMEKTDDSLNNINNYFEILNKINSISNIKFDEKNITNNINRSNKIINYLVKQLQYHNEQFKTVNFNIIKDINNLIKLYSDIFHLYDNIKNIKLNPNIFLKLKLNEFLIKNLISSINNINIDIDFNKKTKQINDLNNYIGLIVDFYNNIYNIKYTPKLLFTDYILGYIINISTFINNNEIKVNKSNIRNLANLKEYILVLVDISEIISKMRMNILGEKILNNNLKILIKVADIVNIVDKIKINKDVTDKLNTMKNIIASIGLVIIAMLIITPVMALFIMASPLIVLCFGAFILIFNTIMLLSRFLLNAKTKLTLLELILFIGVLGLLLLGFIMIAEISIAFVKSIPNILLALGGLVLILLAVGLLGTVVSLISPILLLSVIGFGILNLAILSIFFISVTLLMLQNIKLDKNAILNNVNIVLDTALSIIMSLFDTKLTGIKDNDNPFIKVLKYIGGSITGVLLALSGAVILSATFVSVFAIMMIAGALFLISKINISDKENNIRKQIASILRIVNYIITSLCTPYDMNEPVNKPWYSNLITFTLNGVGKVLQAILAMSMLATSLVSISAILLLATELRILQEINLDGAKIRENVKYVLDTALYVISSIFQPDQTENTPSDKNWFGEVLGWMGNIISGVGAVITSILSIGFLASTMVSIGLIVLLAKSLSYISNVSFDRDGIILKVNDIMFTSHEVVNAVIKPSDKELPKSKDESTLSKLLNWVKDTIGTAGDIITALSGIGYLAMALASIGMLHKLANQLNDINNLPDLSNVITNINKTISTSDNVVNVVINSRINKNNLGKLTTISNKINKINSIISVLRSANKTLTDFTSISDKDVENNTKMINNYIKFIDKINSVNISNIEKTTGMFKEMARLSESINGNFEGLAESLNEKIAPLLIELKELLTEVPKNIENSSKTITTGISKTIIDNANGAQGWTKESIDRNISNYGNDNDQLEYMRNMQSKLSQNAKSDNMRVVELLQDILDALTGQGAYQDGIKVQ